MVGRRVNPEDRQVDLGEKQGPVYTPVPDYRLESGGSRKIAAGPT